MNHLQVLQNNAARLILDFPARASGTQALELVKWQLGTVTDWRVFRHGIKGDVKIISLKSPVSIVPDAEYVVEFPSDNVDNYIEPSTAIPFLGHFTVSFWIKKVVLHPMAIFSYTTSGETNAIRVNINANSTLSQRVMSSDPKQYSMPEIVDDIWHHICVTWTRVEGKVQWFLDGALKNVASGYQSNVTVPGGGILRIGQQQNEFGGSHASSFSFQGKFTRINIWDTVMPDSVIEALAKGPGAEIGDVLSWRDLRTSIFSGEVTAQDDANLQLLAEENNYDLLFASKATTNYATYDYSPFPSLTEFTACLWMRTASSGVHYLFSYSTTSYSDALVLGYDSVDVEIDFNINQANWQYHTLSSAFMHDDGWHHLCASWRNSDGKWCIHINGDMTCKDNYRTDETIQGNGKFFLGQEQDSYGGSFDSSQAFVGRISRVNIWNNMLAQDTVTKMSKGCGLVSGNVVAWHHFKSHINGDVHEETPSWCSVIGPTKQAKLDAYCQNHFSGSDCSEGTTTRAVFDRKQNQIGKQWRCYYDACLTKDSTGYAYDTDKNVACLHSRDAQLRNLLL